MTGSLGQGVALGTRGLPIQFPLRAHMVWDPTSLWSSKRPMSLNCINGQWLASGEWGCLLESVLNFILGQTSDWWKKTINRVYWGMKTESVQTTHFKNLCKRLPKTWVFKTSFWGKQVTDEKKQYSNRV